VPKLPVLSGAEIVKALEKMGFTAVRQRGSHVMMRKGAAGTVVPLHREVKLGALSGILRQAQVPPDDFLNALK
jgi:predicted RNA binding protein YcfA (HicA-like mRNA interferase family)